MHKYTVQNWGKFVDALRQNLSQNSESYTASPTTNNVLCVNTPSYTHKSMVLATWFSPLFLVIHNLLQKHLPTVSTGPTKAKTKFILINSSNSS